MKTKVITTLKKEVLVIELPEDTKSWEFIDGHFWIDDKKTFIKGFSPFHKLLGKPDEISEEDIKDLVESPIDKWGDDKFRFLDYRYDGCYDLFTATESLLSALESEIYWVNPLNNKLDKSQPLIIQTEHLSKWKEAQEKTFDKMRTLIFVKD